MILLSKVLFLGAILDGVVLGYGELSPSFSVVLNDEVLGCCAWPYVERHVVGADRASFPDWASPRCGASSSVG